MSRKSSKSSPETGVNPDETGNENTPVTPQKRVLNPLRARLTYGVYYTELTPSTALVFVHDSKTVNGIAVMDTVSGMISQPEITQELANLCQKRMKRNHGTVKLIGYMPYFSGSFAVVKALVDEFIVGSTNLYQSI